MGRRAYKGWGMGMALGGGGGGGAHRESLVGHENHFGNTWATQI